MPLRRDVETVGGPVDTSSSMPDNWSEFRTDRSGYDPWIHNRIALSPFPALLQPITGNQQPQLPSASA